MTERDKSAPAGSLVVEVSSRSMFLEGAVPVEVRDSRLRLVAKSATTRRFDLPPRLYEVSAVLEDGRRYSELVDAVPGKSTPVSFALSADTAATTAGGSQTAARVSADSTASNYQRPRFTRSMEAAMGSGAESGIDTAADAQLLEVRGASLVRETRTLRVFQCAPAIDTVPSALFQVGTRQLRISLPISPKCWSPSGSCAVRIERNSTGVHAQAWIMPERKVANEPPRDSRRLHFLRAVQVRYRTRRGRRNLDAL